MSEIVKKVYKTKSYDFKTVSGNRDVSDLHVERLRRSMEEDYLLSPMIVNENFEIIDGQHRFEAARELGQPVYYIICKGYGLPEVQRLNKVTKDWTIDDFLNGYADMGDEEYINVLRFKWDYDINSTKLAIGLLNRNKREDDIVTAFRAGKYKIETLKWAQEFVNCLDSFKRYFSDYKTTNFVKAFTKMYDCPTYDHQVMEKKLDHNSGLLEKRTTIREYAILLTEIYNARQRKESRLYYIDGEIRSMQ